MSIDLLCTNRSGAEWTDIGAGASSIWNNKSIASIFKPNARILLRILNIGLTPNSMGHYLCAHCTLMNIAFPIYSTCRDMDPHNKFFKQGVPIYKFSPRARNAQSPRN